MSLICEVAGHRRSAGLAWIDGTHVRSACKRCGIQLVRIERKTWVRVDGRLASQLSH